MRVVENGESFDIVSYHGDYGIPVAFTAKTEDGWNEGDMVVFAVENNIIPAKTWTVSGDNFIFELKFTKEEAERLAVSRYDYSFKQHRDGQYLDTIMNGEIKIKDTTLWQN